MNKKKKIESDRARVARTSSRAVHVSGTCGAGSAHRAYAQRTSSASLAARDAPLAAWHLLRGGVCITHRRVFARIFIGIDRVSVRYRSIEKKKKGSERRK